MSSSARPSRPTTRRSQSRFSTRSAAHDSLALNDGGHMRTWRARPWYCLTRHFFGGLFDLGFLSEAGADSFTRMILGCRPPFLTFGLLLVRIFAARHAALRTPEAYRLALLANHTFLIAVPM